MTEKSHSGPFNMLLISRWTFLYLTALLGSILLGYLAQSMGLCMVRGVAEWLKGTKTPSVSSCCLDRHPAMSALGRFPPFRTLSPQRQLSGAKQTLNDKVPQPNSDRPLLRMKQSLNRVKKRCRERLKTATSGVSQRVETPPKWAEFLLSNQVKADASLTSGGLD